MVDAEVPGDGADASAAVVHRASLHGDELIEQRRRAAEGDLERNASKGSESLRTRPGKETHHNQTEATQLWDGTWDRVVYAQEDL